MVDEFGHGFAPGSVVGAEDEFEPGLPAEVVDDGAGSFAVFVGDDGLAEAAGVELLEEPGGAGEGDEAFEEDFFEVGVEKGNGAGGEFGADEAGHGDFDGAADGGADFFVGGRREAKGFFGVDNGAVDGDEMVHEGAIEVVENGLYRLSFRRHGQMTRERRGDFKT